MNGLDASSARRSTAAIARKPNRRPALVAAYREGLGLASVAAICGPAGIRVVAGGPNDNEALDAADALLACWWCRRAAQAESVAAAATARLRRRELSGAATGGPAVFVAATAERARSSMMLAREAITAAAKHCNVALQSDEELLDEAMGVIARIDDEIESLQRSGDLKSLNKSYRTYRVEASERGERIKRYQQWMDEYREGLIRKLAATLRYF